MIYNISMSKVLIVGNILKDVYLSLDGNSNRFEEDENGTPWLDVAFDSSSHHFFKRTSVFSGSATTMEVLKNFKIGSTITGSKLSFSDDGMVNQNQPAANYRYILCAEDKVSYITSSTKEQAVWQIPNEPIDWIFVDWTAWLNLETAQKILNFLSVARDTKLALCIPDSLSKANQLLAESASIIFSSTALPDNTKTAAKIYYIANNKVFTKTEEQSWQLDCMDLETHLTCRTIVAATTFGALLNNKTSAEALLLAKLNLENSSITDTLPSEKLEEIASKQNSMTMNLRLLAKTLVSADKGILAADESGGSIHKKFEAMGIPDDERHRRDYRNLFFTTPNLEQYVNGVILFDETARQLADDGRNFVEFLTARGIIPGIKTDQGLVDLPGTNEKYTQGLDGLSERLKNYYDMGLRFAKWRAAFEVSDSTPSENAIKKNAEILADYAKQCQTAGIVPIVEPEVVHDGDYSIEQCASITGKILDALFEELAKARVDLGGCLLKCNMVLAGKKYHTQSTPQEVGKMTAKVLKEHVPAELSGVVFLSGGQSVEQSTENLQAVTNEGPFPWSVTFSFARALQGPALEKWQGNNANSEAAKEAFRQRLIANTKALKKA